MKLKFRLLFSILLPLQLLAHGVGDSRSAVATIPGDNNLRYYRLALPVTVSAFQQGYCQNEKISVAEFLKGFDKELTATDFQRFTLRAE